MRVDGLEAQLLSKAMDAALKRHEIASANLANLNTPGYKAREVKFEAAFRDAIANDPQKALEVEPEVVEIEGAVPKADGNTVIMEREITLQQKNAMVFNVLNSVLKHKITVMKQAITGQPRG